MEFPSSCCLPDKKKKELAKKKSPFFPLVLQLFTSIHFTGSKKPNPKFCRLIQALEGTD
jgi:hypothetical protein